MLKGRRVSPVDLYETARKSLHFVGYQGLSIIAVAGLDMAAWDALAKAADVPCAFRECLQQQRTVAAVPGNPRQPRRSNCLTRGAEDSEP
jgi:hypothetical protein